MHALFALFTAVLVVVYHAIVIIRRDALRGMHQWALITTKLAGCVLHRADCTSAL